MDTLEETKEEIMRSFHERGSMVIDITKQKTFYEFQDAPKDAYEVRVWVSKKGKEESTQHTMRQNRPIIPEDVHRCAKIAIRELDLIVQAAIGEKAIKATLRAEFGDL